MKGFGEHQKSKKKKVSKKVTKLSQKQIINQAIQFHVRGNIKEATKYYQELINQGCNDHRIFSNYGVLLKDLGKLQKAEFLYRKAIEIKPDFAEAYYNLGIILSDLGKLEEAQFLYRKAIEIKPDYIKAYSNLGSILSDLGKLEEAEFLYRKVIAINPNYAKAYSNLGIILSDLGKLEEAQFLYHKAIKIKPDFAEAYYNLGIILIDLGKLEEAELSFNKAIEIKPDFAEAYFSLSDLKYSINNKTKWQEQLFSENILNDKLTKHKVNIYFARANILHKEKKYQESSRYLKLANKLKLDIKPYELNNLFSKSQALIIESKKKKINKKEYMYFSESIFIVGMPRSGSTLLESILSMRSDVYDLGEINILEESFLEFKNSKQDVSLAQLYREKVNSKTKLNKTTNKWLYNYQYAGIIAQHIPNAKIIHCYRNPLDNILSIYRAHFRRGNEYSSSLVDSTKVYLDQEEIMTQYKKRFRSKIYDCNYDSLVSNPNKVIKPLISWLGWEWEDKYLSPHLNQRSVSTASNIQVRSPINSKSIGGWKNYKDMLKPAIEILTKTNKYKNIIS